MASDRLNPREELFVAAYIATFNATEAAKKAGYSLKTAKSQGQRLLTRPRVQRALEVRKQRLQKKYQVSAERVLEELSVIGFSNIENYAIDENGNVGLKKSAEENAIRAVSSMRRKLRHLPAKRDEVPGLEIETEFKLWDKNAALTNLGRYLKLFTERTAEPEDAAVTAMSPEARVERCMEILRIGAKRRKQAKGAA